VVRQHHDRSFGYLVELVHEDGTLVLEAAHDVEVVDDLFPDVDGSPVLLEGTLDRVDRAFDAGAVATRSCQEDRSHDPIVPTLGPGPALGRLPCVGRPG
jgi:hypothetical protein